jgi:hypothetical protein
MFFFFSSIIFLLASSLALAASDLSAAAAGDGVFFLGVADLRDGFGRLLAVAGEISEDESTVPI